jgi:hypothetical protein
MGILKIFSLALVLFLFSRPTNAFNRINQTLTTNNWVIFQSFDWDSLSDRGALYNIINNMASDLSNAGIDAVWFPPPSQSIDKQGYLPQQW